MLLGISFQLLPQSSCQLCASLKKKQKKTPPKNREGFWGIWSSSVGTTMTPQLGLKG